jgi:ribose-phosphate pyrophosphokinase
MAKQRGTPMMTTASFPYPVRPDAAGSDDLALFALGGSREFGEQVAQGMGIPLSRHEEQEFEDGEHMARPLVSVRGKDVFVIHSLYADRRQSGNDKLCRLLFFIGALKDAAAARVTAVTPYLAYARIDRKTRPRDPVTSRYVAALFESVGADAIVAMDVHNLAAYQNAFRCRTEHLEANPLFIRHFSAALGPDEEVVVVSPDAGGIKRADRFRKSLEKALGKPVGAAFAEKYRSGGVVSGDMLVGEVGGKQAIIVDDMISTGTTIARTAAACHARGAVTIIAAVSHGLFVGDANSILSDDALQHIVVTDTVPSAGRLEERLKAKLTVLSGTALFASAIHEIHAGGSVSRLLES